LHCSGRFNPDIPFIVAEPRSVAFNSGAARLYEDALRRGEGRVAEGGALVVSTGGHTGRSPADKFILRDQTSEGDVWWANNNSISPDDFATLKRDMLAHARDRHLYVQDLYAGADPRYRLCVRVVCEYAWHALFIRHLLIRPEAADLDGFTPELTIVDLPGFKADPRRHGVRSQTVIACDLTHGLVLIGGTQYAGEMKKSVFTALNYRLPDEGVMPMHCSANVDDKGRSAVFFGLSGTGKTTLSADPSRILIGDDEHGWSSDGIFNFEGGCYAKVIRLSPEAEPDIHATTRRWGTVLENVVVDPESRKLDLDDGSLTENTRAAYPLGYIPNASSSGLAPVPRTIVMLTADAFGVMPPVARLSPAQAMYHFLSGYTAKVAGTERGVVEPQATFSACFAAPFIPRHPRVYGELLRDLIARHEVGCWLVNTGWTGGAYGKGRRMPIAVTRALVDAAVSGALDNQPMRQDPYFGFAVPRAVEGVDARLLDARDTWSEPALYDVQAHKLARMFSDNFAKFETCVDKDVLACAPAMRVAA
jgi:phosphoenolpyruvate carboxykinase (ATP)